eukprot:TRINITY_DN6331_c1_g5_i1.p1 TRINITY_DN6331_c1_g5~~TRINITY_DN6331_c1_g5_i1.p1  ORF type:complete len:810 (+),score=199.95 TRINITY_DN6331_c1_g5_i1:90-2519(+)
MKVVSFSSRREQGLPLLLALLILALVAPVASRSDAERKRARRKGMLAPREADGKETQSPGELAKLAAAASNQTMLHSSTNGTKADEKQSGTLYKVGTCLGVDRSSPMFQVIPAPVLSVCSSSEGPFVIFAGVCILIGMSVAAVEWVRRDQRATSLISSWDATRMLFGFLRGWLTQPGGRLRSMGVVLAVIVMFVIREASFAFILSDINAEVTNSFSSLHESKDLHRVYSSMMKSLLWHFFYTMPLVSIVAPLVHSFALVELRTHITQTLMKAYLAGGGQAYYRIKLGEGTNNIDNPDQRIVDDANGIASIIMSIFSSFLSATIGCAMWLSVILSFGGTRLVSLCLFFTGLRLIAAYFGFAHNLVKYGREVQRREAMLRYGLMRVRDSAEEIALDRGDEREYRRSRDMYTGMLEMWWNNVFLQMRYDTSMDLIGHFPGIFLWFLLLPSLMSGAMGLGDCNRVHTAYEELAKVVGFVVSNFENFAALQCNTERVAELLVAAEVANKGDKQSLWLTNSSFPSPDKKGGGNPDPNSIKQEIPRETSSIRITSCSEDHAIVVKNLAVHLPDGGGGDSSTVRVGGASFACRKGEALLVMGASGSGKTALLRSISGLWSEGRGEIGMVRRYENHVRFVPSKSYIPIGTLAEVIFYPDEPDVSDEKLEVAQEAMRRAKLDSLVATWGWDVSKDWRVILSTGEQQRVGFARLLLHLQTQPDGCKPLVVLDEATSAMDVELERTIYRELRSELAPNGSMRGLVSVGHRPSLLAFHETVLSIGDVELGARNATQLAKGEWTLPDGKQTPWRHVQLEDAEV